MFISFASSTHTYIFSLLSSRVHTHTHTYICIYIQYTFMYTYIYSMHVLFDAAADKMVVMDHGRSRRKPEGRSK